MNEVVLLLQNWAFRGISTSRPEKQRSYSKTEPAFFMYKSTVLQGRHVCTSEVFFVQNSFQEK
jgi:hypothetical protein